jgi:hypothetical protein
MSALSDYIAELLEEYTKNEKESVQASQEAEAKIGAYAANVALNLMGLDIPLDADVNQLTLTQAINAGVLGGEVTFTNLFDKDAVRADVRRIALDRAAASFGYDGAAGVEGLRRKIISDVLRDVRAEIEAGAGDYIDAAPDSAKALDVLNSEKKEDWNTPTDFSEKGEKNRARQATYQASHTRVWVDA